MVRRHFPTISWLLVILMTSTSAIDLVRNTVSGLQVYTVAGNLSKPVMLFLSAFPCSPAIASVSKDMIGYFGETHTVVFYDTRGVGGSASSAPNEKWDGHITDAVSVAKWAAREHGNNKVTVWGYSFGTLLAIKVAARAADVVDKVILTSLKVDQQKSSFILNQAIEQVWGVPSFVSAQLPSEAVLGLAISGPFRYACIRQPRSLECFTGLLFPDARFLYDVYGLQDILRFPAQFAQCTSSIRTELEVARVADKTGPLHARVYVVHGKYDYIDAADYVLPALANDIVAPSHTLVWMYKSGHAPLIEEPEEYKRIMKQFLED